MAFVTSTPLVTLRCRQAACTRSRNGTAVRMVAAPERPAVAVAADRMAVLLPEKLSDEGVSLLADRLTVDKAQGLTTDELKAKIADYDAIIVRSATKLTRDVIESAPKLKVIGRAGVGVDNIDIAAATERGVLVVNAPTGNCIAAAEHAVALMCSLARHVGAADAALKAGRWDRSKYVGASLVNKTLGLVGLGRIGREVAKRAQGLGMSVVATDPLTSEEAAAAIGVELLDRDDVFRRSDFISLHVPLIESTRHLINAKAFAMMKDSVRIVNAARGGVIDEEALLTALDSGKVAGVALDCFEFEPPNKHPGSISEKVVAHPAVLATPHLGASTKEAQEDVAVEIATAVRMALDGDLVPTMINAPPVPAEVLATLKPRAVLCERLGRLAAVVNGGRVAGELIVEYYNAPAGDTRVLRAAVIKGVMETAIDIPITIVNADKVAATHKLSVSETSHFGEHPQRPAEVVIQLHAGGRVVEGRVTDGMPHVTRIDEYELDLRLEGTVVAYSQIDQPGQLGKVGTYLGENALNISSMTLARHAGYGDKALVLLGLDTRPDQVHLDKIGELVGNTDDLNPVVIEF